MKYDPEYNSYRFSMQETNLILESLGFYNQYGPNLVEKDREHINDLRENLENSVRIKVYS
jgi:hypothetical protein